MRKHHGYLKAAIQEALDPYDRNTRDPRYLEFVPVESRVLQRFREQPKFAHLESYLACNDEMYLRDLTTSKMGWLHNPNAKFDRWCIGGFFRGQRFLVKSGVTPIRGWHDWDDVEASGSETNPDWDDPARQYGDVVTIRADHAGDEPLGERGVRVELIPEH